jgi:formylglycine-generating enzyme required for sulfatase activity
MAPPSFDASNTAASVRYTPSALFKASQFQLHRPQYLAFQEADDGFYNPAWWQGLPFERPDKPGKQFNRRDNHPAENIAWDESIAFCRWLSEKLGYEIRLPAEWEWQQAATGGDCEREYPWPGGWDSSLANTYESELNRSTAVGIYPQGASPVGALDMAGNVWEWCLNEYENPKQTGLSGDARRVTRGGSWGTSPGYPRGASRNADVPYYRRSEIGFRLVSVAPILER